MSAQDQGASADADRAVANGAASVSALRASVPSAGRWHRCYRHGWAAIDHPCSYCAKENAHG